MYADVQITAIYVHIEIDIAICALFVRIQNYTPIENGTR
jgi:hypothetical protein